MVRRLIATCSLSVALAALSGAPPAHAVPFSDWQTVSAGSNHTCGIRAGMLFCWGLNLFGQLGDGTNVKRLTPKRITAVSDWKSVTAGSGHTCAIRGTGALYCWGDNEKGQLGDGTVAPRISPKRITAVSDWKFVTSGGEENRSYTCAIRGTGALYCWGDNSSGQLGDGTKTQRFSPKRITAVADWTTIAAGGEEIAIHTCAIRGAGALYCWGDNFNGQLGDGTQTDHLSPKRITAVDDWTSVAAGGEEENSHTCAIRGTGALYCWGYNGTGELGDGTGIQRLSPKRITAVSDWNDITAGALHTCGVRGTGALYCWGGNHVNQLGDGTDTGRLSPVRITAVADWKLVAAGDYHSCAIRGTGALYCWGFNLHGQVGDGTDGNQRSTPTRV